MLHLLANTCQLTGLDGEEQKASDRPYVLRSVELVRMKPLNTCQLELFEPEWLEKSRKEVPNG